MSDARSLLNKEVSLTYPDRGYHRRIAAIAAPVRSSHFETSNEWGGAFIGHNLNRDALINDLGNVRYAQVSLRVSPDADHDFVVRLMAERRIIAENSDCCKRAIFSGVRVRNASRA